MENTTEYYPLEQPDQLTLRALRKGEAPVTMKITNPGYKPSFPPLVAQKTPVEHREAEFTLSTKGFQWRKDRSKLSLNLDVDFEQLALDYQAGRFGGESSWDYIHFRELLAEAMDEAFGTVLYQMLQKQHWFDSRLVSQEQVIDRCLSSFVMAGTARVKGK